MHRQLLGFWHLTKLIDGAIELHEPLVAGLRLHHEHGDVAPHVEAVVLDEERRRLGELLRRDELLNAGPC